MKNLKINANIFETYNKYGNMNTNKAFFPDGMSEEERKAIFLARRIQLGEDLGFDGHYMFMADQNTRDGSYRIIDKKLVDSTDDGWKIDTDEDILIIGHETPGVAICHPVADCNVVIATDKKQGKTALGHCGGAEIDIKMPQKVVQALQKQYGSTNDDIMVYVGVGAGPSWTYDSYPGWAQHEEIWDEAIKEENGIYKINMKKALERQFAELEVGNVIYNPTDTITSDSCYSNSQRKIKPEKAGRQLTGAFYKTR